jgi:uncharacterized membrane-anchored protein YhcB (DUF1043 family)
MKNQYLSIFWPEHPILSTMLWIILTITIMYFCRPFAHHAIRSFFKVVHSSLRLASRALLSGEKRLTIRNREVLISSGREAAEKEIEREFHRVGSVVKRDLQGFPAHHRKMGEIVDQIDQDYRESSEMPPNPPAWINAISSVAKIPAKGDPMVANLLGEIKRTLERQQKEVMDEFRKTSGKRHRLLGKMAPHWRKLSQSLEEVGKSIHGLFERSAVIDGRMREYEDIVRRTDKAERMLSSSSLTQFIISGVVVLIAIGGAVINFNLIALPMSEMVGGGSYIGPFKTADVAALVIILVESAMGIYLMESLRITRLFPMIGSLDDKLRRKMIWVTLSILIILASIEASLAFMRDMIAADIEALRQSLAGVTQVAKVNRWIPTLGQMVMGFILPFALAFVAIPLESFVHSSRTVLGVSGAAFLRILATILRITGTAFKYAGEVIVNLYDVVVFPFLWIEKAFRERGETVENRREKEVLQ